MDITYLGHASFKLRGKEASAVTDPFASSIGFSLPRISADVVTISHSHEDHNNVRAVSGTSRRAQTFVIDAPGEYEVSGVSVFGTRTFHDAKQGSERGQNTVFVIQVDGVLVAHLGDLGHVLSDKQVERIGAVDVLLIPVGGVYTIDSKDAITVISQLQPSIVIPMHYKTRVHNDREFGELEEVDTFLGEGGYDQTQKLNKLTVTKASLPDEMGVVVLKSG